jgi:hypothetical protein
VSDTRRKSQRFSPLRPFEIDGNRISISGRGFYVINGIIGLGFFIVIAFFVFILIKFNHEINHRIHTDKEIAKIARKVYPTPKQVNKRIEDAIKHCAVQPSCRRALTNLVAAEQLRRHKVEKPHSGSSTSNTGNPSGKGNASPPTHGAGAVVTPSKPGIHRSKTNPCDHSGSNTSSGSGSQPNPVPTPSPAPTPTKPLIDVPLGPAPSVCIDHILGVNC